MRFFVVDTNINFHETEKKVVFAFVGNIWKMEKLGSQGMALYVGRGIYWGGKGTNMRMWILKKVGEI